MMYSHPVQREKLVYGSKIGSIQLSDVDSKFLLALCDVDGVHHETNSDSLGYYTSTHHNIGGLFVPFLEMVESRRQDACSDNTT